MFDERLNTSLLADARAEMYFQDVDTRVITRWSDCALRTLVNALSIRRPELSLQVEEAQLSPEENYDSIFYFESRPCLKFVAAYSKDFNYYFNQPMKGFRRIKKIEAFYRKMVECAVFTDGTHTLFAINAHAYDIRPSVAHMINGCLTAALPGVFDVKDISNEEAKIIEALCQGTKEDFEDAILPFLKMVDFDRIVTKGIKKFCHDLNESRCEKYRRNVKNFESEIDRLNQMILDQTQMLEEARAVLYSMTINENNGDELAEYFKSNDALEFNGVKDGKLEFSVLGILAYFDPEYAAVLLDKYDFDWGGWTQDEGRAMFKALFVDEILKIKFGYSFTMDSRYEIKPRTNSFVSQKKDYYPNPHLNSYQCLGTHKTLVNDCLRKGEVIPAIEQLIAATLNLNLQDATVSRDFIRNYPCFQEECIILPDGTNVTPNEAKNWLMEYLKEVD